MSTTRRKLVIGSSVIVAALAAVAYQGARSSMVYYLTPTEFASRPDLRAMRVRLAARVLPGSFEKVGEVYRFAVGDGTTSYRVQFGGSLPDLFSEGREVLVEGRLDASEVLQAVQVITTHPVEYKEMSDRYRRKTEGAPGR